MSLTIALRTLSFWCLFAAGVYFDPYLNDPLLGVILKSLAPIAVLANILGIVAGVVSVARKRERPMQSIPGIALNALPILVLGSVLYWWIFLFKM